MPVEPIGAIAAAAAVQARHVQSIKKADAAWSAYASAHGLAYQAPRGWFRKEWPRADGKLDGVTIAIEAAIYPTHWDYSTALVAIPSAPLTGTLELTREGFHASVAKLFGADDLVLGDDAFDRAFFVRAANEATARKLLTPAVRAEILALQLDRLVYDDGATKAGTPMVVAELVGIVDKSEILDRALRLVAGLARVS